jgi:formate dehydrogenase subunit gamma
MGLENRLQGNHRDLKNPGAARLCCATPASMAVQGNNDMKKFSGFFSALAVTMLLVVALAAPTAAQQNFKPTEQSVKEQQLLDALKPGGTVSGRVSIPDQRSSSLIQPEGRGWQDFRRGTLSSIGTVAIVGMIVLLAIFLMVRGRIRIEKGFSGRTITRFPSFDRFVHWVTASCFIVLALTGLNITFGKVLIAPLFGENAFGSLSALGKLAHNYLAFPFMAGVLFMFLIWVKDNIPNALDLQWIKAGGGIFAKGVHPPAKRFNAGQKGIFWIVVIGGALMSFSGWHLLFPTESIADLQFQSNIHGIVGMLFIAAMIAHIYIGSIGMEGAFDAMGSGEVDENWAKEHHSLWLEEEKAKAAKAPPGAVAAE